MIVFCIVYHITISLYQGLCVTVWRYGLFKFLSLCLIFVTVCFLKESCYDDYDNIVRSFKTVSYTILNFKFIKYYSGRYRGRGGFGVIKRSRSIKKVIYHYQLNIHIMYKDKSFCWCSFRCTSITIFSEISLFVVNLNSPEVAGLQKIRQKNKCV